MTAPGSRAPHPSSAVVTVGDELLLGRTVDTNAAWLGSTLADLGLPVARRWTVGDDRDAIRDAVRSACEAAEVVVVTGGLGPTDDDLTREAVAGLFGRPLRRDSALLEALERRFRESGFLELPVRNLGQTLVPEGAEVLPNPHGTAPGLLLHDEGRWIALVPGVPREMRGIVESELVPRLRSTFAGRLRPTRHRTIRTTGIAESVLAERMEREVTAELGPVTVAYLPDLRGVDLRLTVAGIEDEEEARRWLERAEDAIRPVVDPYRYEAPGGDLVESLAGRLLELGWTVAIAESCTGGLVARRLTERAGASGYFRGGIVAYSNDLKTGLLGVSSDLLERTGAVSRQAAEAMAVGVADRLGADVGLGITGVAGPGGGTPEKPVGTVWYAASVRGEVTSRGRRFPGDRSDVRERSGQALLALLHERLRDRR